MRAILSERNLVIVLFVLVLVAFSFAQEDSKKMKQNFAGTDNTINTSTTALSQNKPQTVVIDKESFTPANLSGQSDLR